MRLLNGVSLDFLGQELFLKFSQLDAIEELETTARHDV